MGDKNIAIAKLAEQAERYEDMADVSIDTRRKHASRRISHLPDLKGRLAALFALVLQVLQYQVESLEAFISLGSIKISLGGLIVALIYHSMQ